MGIIVGLAQVVRVSQYLSGYFTHKDMRYKIKAEYYSYHVMSIGIQLYRL